MDDALLVPGNTLVTQMETDPASTARLIHRARARGVRTIHNLAPAAPLAEDALRALDILVVNEEEGTWLGTALGGTGGGALGLHRSLGITVIRTLGAGGVEWAEGGCHATRPVPPTEVRDTTAAGDCFVGVLAAALDRSAALGQAIARAVAAASLSCTRIGSQSSLPDAHETDAALLRHPAR